MKKRSTRPAPDPRPPPPPHVVVSPEAAESARHHALKHQAVRAARSGRTREALKLAFKALGIPEPKRSSGGGPGGRRGYSEKERSDLADLYINMMTAPGPYRPRYFRTDRLDILMAHSAEGIDCQREGKPIPPLPAEVSFVPDCDVPMGKEDALRNVKNYLGRGRLWAWKLLNAEMKRRRSAGIENLDLPPRDRLTAR